MFVASLLGLALCLAGCVTASSQQREAAAKALFEQTVQHYHLPSADAKGTARDQLLAHAAANYARLLRTYSEQRAWCALTLRSLANVRAEQGHLKDAVTIYRQVGEHYPEYGWEVIQAWKSAADLLWDAHRPDDARRFYRNIVARFDRPDAPPIIQTIVRGAQTRLAEQ